ncbi:MAG: hypothetical protein A2269_00885 [Lentisphaerae bacterium RIFOXYA12_FULL_60_10]|nr:MAG: hypothetical protein A2269_00885 [Lentisphaerae bacterium RIFOXYA12_FULL_60_10]
MKFWDASAIVPLLVRQARSAELMELLEQDPLMITWWGTPVECLSALLRLVREGHLVSSDAEVAERRLREFRGRWDEVIPGEACRRMAERMLRVHALRSADALQLAAGVLAADHDPARLEFVCLDRRLCEAGRKEGFILPLRA